jgi:hypothetical protein
MSRPPEPTGSQPPQRLVIATFTLPPLAEPTEALWSTLFDFVDLLPADKGVLIGGQMVLAHALAAGRTPPRISRDVDLLADVVTSAAQVAYHPTAAAHDLHRRRPSGAAASRPDERDHVQPIGAAADPHRARGADLKSCRCPQRQPGP